MKQNEFYQKYVDELLALGDKLFEVAKEFYNLLDCSGMSQLEVAQECAKIEVDNFYR